jgi:anti-sigma B factor antagonist
LTSAFACELSFEHDEPIISARGEVDIATSGELEDQVMGALGGTGSRLVVDLAEVTFIDSSGLNALVRGRRAAAEQGARLILRAPGPQVRTALQASALDGVFEME